MYPDGFRFDDNVSAVQHDSVRLLFAFQVDGNATRNGEIAFLQDGEETDVVVARKDGSGQSDILIAFSSCRSGGDYEWSNDSDQKKHRAALEAVARFHCRLQLFFSSLIKRLQSGFCTICKLNKNDETQRQEKVVALCTWNLIARHCHRLPNVSSVHGALFKKLRPEFPTGKLSIIRWQRNK